MASDYTVARAVGASAVYNLLNVLSCALPFGIYVPLCLGSISTLRHRSRGVDAKASARLLLFILVIAVSTTTFFVSNIAYSFLSFNFATSPSAASHADTATVDDLLEGGRHAATVPNIIQGCCELINFLTGDAMVIYRASLLFADSKGVRYTLWGLFIVNIGVAMSGVAAVLKTFLDSNHETAWAPIAGGAAYIVSFLLNLVATIAILVKAWNFRKTMQTSFSSGRIKRSMVYKALTLLLETGSLFCLVQLMNGVASLTDDGEKISSSAIAGAVIGNVSVIFAAAYPSVVVTLLEKHGSTVDNSTLQFLSGDGHSDRSPGAINQNSMDQHHLSTLRFRTTTSHGDSSLSNLDRFTPTHEDPHASDGHIVDGKTTSEVV